MVRDLKKDPRRKKFTVKTQKAMSASGVQKHFLLSWLNDLGIIKSNGNGTAQTVKVFDESDIRQRMDSAHKDVEDDEQLTWIKDLVLDDLSRRDKRIGQRERFTPIKSVLQRADNVASKIKKHLDSVSKAQSKQFSAGKMLIVLRWLEEQCFLKLYITERPDQKRMSKKLKREFVWTRLMIGSPAIKKTKNVDLKKLKESGSTVKMAKSEDNKLDSKLDSKLSKQLKKKLKLNQK